MRPPLQIYDRRERAYVRAADALLNTSAALIRPFRRRFPPRDPRRILLLRLERIGDLVMTLPAIAQARAAAPGAEIDLVVGSWNENLARALPGVSRVRLFDARWLSRGDTSTGSILRELAEWRRAEYDVGINFEPDIRSNILLSCAGTRWTVGYRSGGGGPLLDRVLDYRPEEHTADNAGRLIHDALGSPRQSPPATLLIPEEQRQEAGALLSNRPRPLIAMHIPGGRPVKQWEPEKFAAVASELLRKRGGTIVLTGGPGDRPVISHVAARLPTDRVVDVSTVTDLLTIAAVLSHCDLIITGDTGPMHLAHAVGTPIVAVFGPSDPRRYAPRGARDRVVRIDLPCAPCNRIRLPPARCTGHTPDCLALIGSERVLDVALAVVDARGGVWNASV